MSETTDSTTFDPFAGGDAPDNDTSYLEDLKSSETLDDSADEGDIEVEALVEETQADGAESTGEVEAEETDGAVDTAVAVEPEIKEDETNIPKWRLDREVRRRRALEEQLQATRSRGIQPAPLDESQLPKIDVGARAKEMFDKVLDGDMDASVQTFSDIIADVIKQTTQTVTSSVDQRVQQATRETQTRSSTQQVISRLKDTYEVLDDTSDKFDPDLTARTLTFQRAYIDEGLTPADALEQAAEDAIKLMRPEVLQARAPVNKPIAPARNVKQKVEAARQQPPRTKGLSQKESRTVNIFSMKDEDFEKLTAAELARLRGDFA